MTNSAYQFSLTACDVAAERRASLEAFRAKRKQWVEWLDEDPDHAIWTALSGMVWSDVSFRTLAQAAINDPETCLTNTLVAEKIIHGHVATQILAIRRLVDKTRGVISLRKLLQDVRSNFSLLTRENYVCFDGLPFDYEPVMQREMAARAGSGPFWASRSGPGAWAMSQMIHEHFDRLSGIRPEARKREDRLPVALLDVIESWLDVSGADELADWSHAFLAHAGSSEARQEMQAAIITNDKITEVIKQLSRVTEALSGEVLFASGRLNALMPTPQFDVLAKLDKPALTENDKGAARQLWENFANERDAFCGDVRTSLLGAARRSSG